MLRFRIIISTIKFASYRLYITLNAFIIITLLENKIINKNNNKKREKREKEV